MAKSLGSAPPGETGWPRRCSPGAGLADPSSRSKGATGSRRRLSDSANLTSIADGIGECWEVLNNAYKPYPCGVVLFPIPAVRARSSFRWITLVGGSDWALRRLARLTRLSRSLWQSRRVPDPNFNLTPRALQMTDDAPTGAVRAVASDCWPNLGLRGPGVFVAMRDRQAGLLPRPAGLYFALLRAPETTNIAPQSSGDLQWPTRPFPLHRSLGRSAPR